MPLPPSQIESLTRTPCNLESQLTAAEKRSGRRDGIQLLKEDDKFRWNTMIEVRHTCKTRVGCFCYKAIHARDGMRAPIHTVHPRLLGRTCRRPGRLTFSLVTNL